MNKQHQVDRMSFKLPGSWSAITRARDDTISFSLPFPCCLPGLASPRRVRALRGNPPRTPLGCWGIAGVPYKHACHDFISTTLREEKAGGGRKRERLCFHHNPWPKKKKFAEMGHWGTHPEALEQGREGGMALLNILYCQTGGISQTTNDG